ncbi:hypothetical protein HaLaN_27669 [Haematococcus lacustris]|uniref:Uncharacterized protein n=1 Tax=Haematococcus lacustris TaxID=44745 RepID=A0A6A0AAF3_HAELA|nr:hypothetical protein HaLaN_27669 [Haematococcus lacustris]
MHEGVLKKNFGLSEASGIDREYGNYIVTKLHVQVDPSEGAAVTARPVWPQLCLGWRTAGSHVRRLPGHLLLPVLVTQLCAVQRAVGPEPGQLQATRLTLLTPYHSPGPLSACATAWQHCQGAGSCWWADGARKEFAR